MAFLLGGGVQPEGQKNSGALSDLFRETMNRVQSDKESREAGKLETEKYITANMNIDRGFYGHSKVQGTKEDSSGFYKHSKKVANTLF